MDVIEKPTPEDMACDLAANWTALNAICEQFEKDFGPLDPHAVYGFVGCQRWDGLALIGHRAAIRRAMAAEAVLRSMIAADECWEDPLQAAHYFVNFVAMAKATLGER